MHYQRVLTFGDPGPVGSPKVMYRAMHGKTCEVEGCDGPARAKMMCMFHYDRLRHSGSVGVDKPKRRALPAEMRDYTPGERHRWYKYGLSREAFNEMLVRQGGCCYICRTDTPNGKGWSVDHCHETDTVRFIACNPCNAALGMIREDPAIAKRLYEVALECQQLRLI
jgi:hypothetical protein